jgi:hypothetical protein
MLGQLMGWVQFLRSPIAYNIVYLSYEKVTQKIHRTGQNVEVRARINFFLFRKESQVEVYTYTSTYEKAWKLPVTI